MLVRKDNGTKQNYVSLTVIRRRLARTHAGRCRRMLTRICAGCDWRRLAGIRAGKHRRVSAQTGRWCRVLAWIQTEDGRQNLARIRAGKHQRLLAWTQTGRCRRVLAQICAWCGCLKSARIRFGTQRSMVRVALRSRYDPRNSTVWPQRFPPQAPQISLPCHRHHGHWGVGGASDPGLPVLPPLLELQRGEQRLRGRREQRGEKVGRNMNEGRMTDPMEGWRGCVTSRRSPQSGCRWKMEKGRASVEGRVRNRLRGVSWYFLYIFNIWYFL